MMMRKDWRRKRKMSTGTHYAVLVERSMPPMSFGSAVMYVSGGSMASVSRSLRPRPSTSSSISALLAAVIKEFVLDKHLIRRKLPVIFPIAYLSVVCLVTNLCRWAVGQ
ncbi:hypothetical protein Droror1_Dr00007176 [Drosera rotundifolia]